MSVRKGKNMVLTATDAGRHFDARAIASSPSDEEKRYAIALGLSKRNAASASCDVSGPLKSAGIRSTRQREAIVKCLFGGPDRHLTAEMLFEELSAAGVRASLATVYNTLNLLLDAALLKQVCVDGSKTYFDTNTGPHQHFYFEDTRELVDIPRCDSLAGNFTFPSEEYDLARVDVIVRVRKKRVTGA
jgi:Fur family iron response transcriptional regulator